MAEPSAAPEREEADQRGGFVKFWTTLPGVLTGVAAVIAAVVSLVAVFASDDDPAGTAAAPVSAAAPGPAASVGSTVASSGSSASGEADGRVAGEGRLELRVDDWADLGAGTVSGGRTTTSEFSLFRSDSYFLNAAIAQTFAVPEDGADREACVRALERRSDRLLPLSGLREGATVCVLTGDADIAALRLTALPAVGSPRVAFDYTIWAT